MRDFSGEVIPFKPRQRVAPRREWSAEIWAEKNWPWIHLATAALAKSDAEFDAAISRLFFDKGKDDALAVIFRRLREVKRDLDEMREAVDMTLNRALEAVERIGRSPGGPHV